MTSPEDLAQRINWVIQETPFEKVSPELWARIQAGVVKVGDHHDEDTMMKVAKTLEATLAYGLEAQNISVTEVISALQSAGILFRERGE